MLTALMLLIAASVALPGGPPVGMDYLAYDASNARVWVPAGNTGNVDVVDAATGKVTPVGGFPTAPSSRPGRPNRGPSSAAIGDHEVWIGNRADDTVCAVDARTLARGRCIHLPSAPDGLVYVPNTRELWVTTPRDQSITIVDVSGKSNAPPVAIKLPGDPEGVVVDPGHGFFYTNLEDKDQTLEIEVHQRKIVASWPTGCGHEGPRGLAIDAGRRLLFVACSSDGAVEQNLAHDGKVVGRVKTGGGVDNIDYAAGPGLLLVPSGHDGKLTTARVAPNGALTKVAVSPTAPGARCVVAGIDGTGYVADAAGGRLIVVKPPPATSR